MREVVIFVLIVCGKCDFEEGLMKATKEQLGIFEKIRELLSIGFSLESEASVKSENFGQEILHFVEEVKHLLRKIEVAVKSVDDSSITFAFMGLEEDASKLTIETKSKLMFKSSYRGKCVNCLMLEDVHVCVNSMTNHLAELLTSGLEKAGGRRGAAKKYATFLKLTIEASEDFLRSLSGFANALSKVGVKRNGKT